jgi:hypothetical protein
MSACVLRRVFRLVSAIVPLVVVGGLVPHSGASLAAQQRDCRKPLPEPVMTFNVPSGELTQTSDGCWLFGASVEIPDVVAKSGIAALRRTDSGVELHRFLPLSVPRLGGPTTPVVVGMAMTHDDRMLVVSHNQRLTFLDVRKLTSDDPNPVLGVIESPRLSISWGVVVSTDDKYAYAAQQGTASVVVVDLDSIRKGIFDQSALVGLIPTAPQATTTLLSPDGRHLFTTTLRSPDVLEATPPCAGTKQPQGAVHVADTHRARTDPKSATLGFAHPAGCSPISATLSPDGSRLSTVAPGPAVNPPLSALDSSIVAFDTRPTRDGKPPTLIARVPVPPQVIRAVDSGDRLFLAFLFGGPNQPNPVNIMVLDAPSIASGKAKVLGRLPVAGIGLTLSPDRRTLFVGSAGWNTLTVVDLERVKLEPPAN